MTTGEEYIFPTYVVQVKAICPHFFSRHCHEAVVTGPPSARRTLWKTGSSSSGRNPASYFHLATAFSSSCCLPPVGGRGDMPHYRVSYRADAFARVVGLQQVRRGDGGLGEPGP